MAVDPSGLERQRNTSEGEQDAKEAPKGKPISEEPCVKDGEKGVKKTYKDGSSKFFPDKDSNDPPKSGHDRGRNTRARGNEEHSKNAKGNRTPPSMGGANRSRSTAGEVARSTGKAVVVGAIAYGGWECVKWTAAVILAPETGGGSLVAAGVCP